ncbi:hypothetical protein [Arthrobacter glacialis]|uniref:Cyclase n=1 Tax=Arthrobacter glacialis TaxID=1664 RepID=A0A2S3ZTZ1_ARTGL|nr:hypothetical protein [Arthrobacter glacialis]POH58067.1 hypothetical protein CVS28_13170 [Arthrobacter glacialis]POH72725.1 hypothetical protein CVS27_14000 [Arthrobacter glacialis]
MFTLQIEHGIKDFGMWKSAYDADPLGREASGVRAERVFRPVGEEHYVVLDLDFATQAEAEQFLGRLKAQVWSAPSVSPALAGGPKTRIVEQLIASRQSQ